MTARVCYILEARGCSPTPHPQLALSPSPRLLGSRSYHSDHAHTQAISSVGTGAAKVAGGAIKYTAKGIWNVGKYATR